MVLSFQCDHCGSDCRVDYMWHLREGSHIARICPSCALVAYQAPEPTPVHTFRILPGGKARRPRRVG